MKNLKFPKNIKNNLETIIFFNDLLTDKNKEIYYSMKGIEFFEASIVPYFH